MTPTDLLNLRLTPEQFMAMSYVVARKWDGKHHVRTEDLAMVLGCGVRKAALVISSLIEAGLIIRIRRGVYEIKATKRAEEVHTDAEEVHGGALPWYVDKQTSTDYMAREVTDVTSLGGVAPVKGIELITEKRAVRNSYDDGDDLAGFGLTEPRQPKAKPKPKRAELQFHRSVPRSEWTMQHVAKEFRMRVSQLGLEAATGGIIGLGTNGNRLAMALSQWQSDYQIKPQDAATILDQFFADSSQTSRISNDFPAYTIYLDYLKRNIDRTRGTEISDDYREKVKAQVLPWQK